jgi:uncharacterized membrane protein
VRQRNSKQSQATKHDNGGGSSIHQLTRRNVEAVAELEKAASANRGHGDRIADVITRFVGSMSFVYLHVLWFTLWIIGNSSPVLASAWRVDPFPYTFLTFIVSLEAIFLSTFILISQNHEERLAQRRSHLDLQVNLLSEQENSKMLQMLDAIHEHLGINVDAETKQLEETTQPRQLAHEIEESIEQPQAKAK